MSRVMLWRSNVWQVSSAFCDHLWARPHTSCTYGLAKQRQKKTRRSTREFYQRIQGDHHENGGLKIYCNRSFTVTTFEAVQWLKNSQGNPSYFSENPRDGESSFPGGGFQLYVFKTPHNLGRWFHLTIIIVSKGVGSTTNLVMLHESSRLDWWLWNPPLFPRTFFQATDRRGFARWSDGKFLGSLATRTFAKQFGIYETHVVKGDSWSYFVQLPDFWSIKSLTSQGPAYLNHPKLCNLFDCMISTCAVFPTDSDLYWGIFVVVVPCLGCVAHEKGIARGTWRSFLGRVKTKPWARKMLIGWLWWRHLTHSSVWVV